MLDGAGVEPQSQPQRIQVVADHTRRLRFLSMLGMAIFAMLLFFGAYFAVVTNAQNKVLDNQLRSQARLEHILNNQAASQARGESVLNRLERTDKLIRRVIRQAEDPKMRAQQRKLVNTILREEREIQVLLRRTQHRQ